MQFTTGIMAAAAGVLAISVPALAQAQAQAPASSALPLYTAPANAPQCRGSDGYSADFDGRRTFLWRPEWLEMLAADKKLAKKAVRAGDKALDNELHTVTDKRSLLPGATPHNYASVGPYWWPDPAKADGLPYIVRDGVANPARNGPDFDKVRQGKFSRDMEALSIAYYITGNERYAKRAALLLRTWFINPDTRMAPNLEFAQGVPGRVTGRPEGVIEAFALSRVVESIGLLGNTEALNADDHRQLRQWYGDFTNWLTTSKIGMQERKKTNNHGVFYDYFLTQFSLFAGADEAASDVIEAFPQVRLAVQMDAEGRFPNELRRTKNWHYSNYVLSAAGRLATIGECLGKNLWDAPAAADGRTIWTGINYVEQFSNDLSKWPYDDIDYKAGKFANNAGAYWEVELLGLGRDAKAIEELP